MFFILFWFIIFFLFFLTWDSKMNVGRVGWVWRCVFVINLLEKEKKEKKKRKKIRDEWLSKISNKIKILAINTYPHTYWHTHAHAHKSQQNSNIDSEFVYRTFLNSIFFDFSMSLNTGIFAMFEEWEFFVFFSIVGDVWLLSFYRKKKKKRKKKRKNERENERKNERKNYKKKKMTKEIK